MTIQIRIFEEKDYPTVAGWWKGHGWAGVPREMLPKLGVIAEENGKPVAAAWLYMDNSVGVSMMEWLVSDPVAGGVSIFRAIGLICEFLAEEAKRLDYGIMLTSCQRPGLVKIYGRSGFEKTDEGMTHMVKILRTEEGE